MVDQLLDYVCAVDGVPIAQAKSGAWVHTDEVPENAPDHYVQPLSRKTWFEDRGPHARLRETATDMLQHHATIHPASDCEWAVRLRDALRAR